MSTAETDVAKKHDFETRTNSKDGFQQIGDHAQIIIEAASPEGKADDLEREGARNQAKHPMDRDFEGGFGGQEDLEDRYATTSGEH